MKKSAHKLGIPDLFEKLDHIMTEYNAEWQKRKRKIDTRFIVLFLIELVSGALGDSFRMLLQNLRHRFPPSWKGKSIDVPTLAPSSVCEARQKISEEIFILLNEEIVKFFDDIPAEGKTVLKGRRVFAMDASKLNLPLELSSQGFHSMTAKGQHPQGMVSCLYDLQKGIPVDWLFGSKGNERSFVRPHISKLRPNDVVIYDRGYFSFDMVKAHESRNVDFIFRLPRNGFKCIKKFMDDPEESEDTLIQLEPEKASKRVMKCVNGITDFTPVNIRLIRKKHLGKEYFFATSLNQSEVTLEEVFNAYAFRWDVEEFFKIPKAFLELEKFHSKSRRGIEQEIGAAFLLVSLSRVFSAYAEKSKVESPAYQKKAS